MKIASPFKDYYDYIGYQYGADETIRYQRMPLPTNDKVECVIHVIDKDLPRLPYASHENGSFYQYKWLAICGKLYLLVSVDYSEYHLLDANKHKNFTALSKSHWFYKNKPVYYHVESNEVVEISRKLHAPVFSFSFAYNGIERKNVVTIDTNIPILANIGLPKIIAPEQMYQNISYFMANTINPSPDLIVNDNLTNKEKIISHGFDLKTSFRHRKLV